MRHHLLLPVCLLLFGLGACADNVGSMPLADAQSPPVGQPDSRIVDPLGADGHGGGHSNGTGGGSQGGNHGGGGGGGGAPVPEPGTMLLVGTGLAVAAMLRRRRQQAK